VSEKRNPEEIGNYLRGLLSSLVDKLVLWCGESTAVFSSCGAQASIIWKSPPFAGENKLRCPPLSLAGVLHVYPECILFIFSPKGKTIQKFVNDFSGPQFVIQFEFQPVRVQYPIRAVGIKQSQVEAKEKTPKVF